MKPTCIIIGAMKAGTTSLAELFRQHPQIFMSRPKEIHFFDRDENYAKGIEWYESHFAEAGDRPARVEATPNYAMIGTKPEVLDRIAEHVPDAKFIFMARHPIERLRSHWSFFKYKNPNLPPLGQALRDEPRFIDGSMYANALKAYQSKFGADRVHVIFLDDFSANPASELEKVCRFIGVDSAFQFQQAEQPRNQVVAPGISGWIIRNMPWVLNTKKFIPLHIRGWVKRNVLGLFHKKPELDPKTRQWIVQQLKDDTAEFLRLCGKPADFWRMSRVAGLPVSI